MFFKFSKPQMTSLQLCDNSKLNIETVSVQGPIKTKTSKVSHPK